MIRRSHLLLATLIPLLGSMACAQQAKQPATTRPFPTSQPFRGVTYRQEVRTDPPLRLHIVTIDLTDPAIRLVVRPGGDDPDGEGPWNTVLRPVSSVASREGLDVAINGDFFSGKDRLPIVGSYFEGNWAKPVGMAMSDGKVWCKGATRPALVVDAAGKVTIGAPAPLVAKARQIVAGNAMVLTKGKVVGVADAPAPRTGAGIDATGGRLVLLVIDGRQPNFSAGVSQRQLGEELLKLGCIDGLNLDGGGSTTLVMRDAESGQWRILNRPSDGHESPVPMSVERPVANVFGVVTGTEAR